jgi:hypothetical protein
LKTFAVLVRLLFLFEANNSKILGVDVFLAFIKEEFWVYVLEELILVRDGFFASFLLLLLFVAGE